MPNEGAKVKMLTVGEANSLLPKIQSILVSLRDLRGAVLRTQAQIEIEEMTGSTSDGKISDQAQAAITQCMESFQVQTGQFEEQLNELFQIGAHLKDLDGGLIDFYSRRGSDVILLCWKEGETEVGYWHSLQGGFQNRKPL